MAPTLAVLTQGKTLAVLTQANKGSDSLIGKTAVLVMRCVTNDNTNTPTTHTAPQRCQPGRLVTPDFLLGSSYCDQDMTISVAR